MSIFSVVAPTLGTTFASAPSATAAGSPAGASFGDVLSSALSNVNDLQNTAGNLAEQFAVGKTSDIQGVMIASEKAGIALDLTTQIRNKVVSAYQDIMQIQM